MVTINRGSFPQRSQASVIVFHGAEEDMPAIPRNKCADRLEGNPFPHPPPFAAEPAAVTAAKAFLHHSVGRTLQSSTFDVR